MTPRIVNSYCIFNNYTHVLPLLLRVHHAIFPKTWTIKIYHDKNLTTNPYYKKVLLQLQEKKYLELQLVDETVLKCRAMLWRMLPLWENKYEYFFCRDADSIPTLRERKVMEHFVTSKYCACGINDNQAHDLPMMGGMIGFDVEQALRIINYNTWNEMISSFTDVRTDWGRHGQDQQLLNKDIFPKIKDCFILYRLHPNASAYPHTKCVYNVPEININDVNHKIKEYSDYLICYIGASGHIRDYEQEFEYIKAHDCNSVLEFYNKFGNENFNQCISELEGY